MTSTERKIISIMDKYYYTPKVDLPLDEIREIKLNELLGIGKRKKINKDTFVFIGVDCKSVQHRERKIVYEFYYKQNKTDEEIEEIWRQTQRLKSKRKIYF
jgi:hypothetical protein